MPTEPRTSTWITYPSPGDNFKGYFTDVDASRVPDLGAPNGQNTTPNEGDRISIRDYGFSIFPSTATLSTTLSPTTSAWTFHKRDGEQILVRAYGANLEWFDETSQAWVNLGNAYTSADFGFAEMNINTDAVSYLYFGNAVEDWSRWTGAHTNLNGALAGAEATITVDSTTGFTATGTVRIGTTNVTYTGVTATTFTGCVGTPAAADNLAVAQGVLTSSGNPKGNIYLAADNRLFIAGITAAPQAVYFSQYADATNFAAAAIVTGSTAASPGIFNLVEGGGAVTAMVRNEETNYFFKENIIYGATLSDTLYSLVPLKPFDGRSQTTGAKSKKSVFVGGNAVFFVSKDNQIFSLERVATIDYPQMVPISRDIQPTVDSVDFSSLSGIVFGKFAYFACKSSTDAAVNDTVLVYNIEKGTWDTPVVNFNAADWAVYKQDATEELYFSDATSPNFWKVTSTPVDYQYNTLASWRTKRYDFGSPQSVKELDGVFIEGYIADNTTLTINLYLDENGVTQSLSTEFVGTETAYLFEDQDLNPFGLSAFGSKRFGSNDDTSGKKKFRVYLNKNIRRTPFFNAQLEFVSNGSNQQWEVLRYGFQVRQHSQPIPTALMRDW